MTKKTHNYFLKLAFSEGMYISKVPDLVFEYEQARIKLNSKKLDKKMFFYYYKIKKPWCFIDKEINFKEVFK